MYFGDNNWPGYGLMPQIQPIRTDLMITGA